MSYRRLQLSVADLRRLEAACGFSHPIRRRPSHSRVPRVERSTWTRTWSFPTEAAAEKWNAAWENALAGETDLPEPLLEVEGRVPSRLFELVARIAASVVMEEIVAGNPYPHGVAGGRYQLRVEHVYEDSPLAGGRRALILQLHGRTYQADGELFWAFETTREYPTEALDSRVAEALACARSRHLGRDLR